jgi:hypothetical protein
LIRQEIEQKAFHAAMGRQLGWQQAAPDIAHLLIIGQVAQSASDPR